STSAPTWICSSWRKPSTISSSFPGGVSACTSAATSDTCWKSMPRPIRRSSLDRQVVADGNPCGNRQSRRHAAHQRENSKRVWLGAGCGLLPCHSFDCPALLHWLGRCRTQQRLTGSVLLRQHTLC